MISRAWSFSFRFLIESESPLRGSETITREVMGGDSAGGTFVIGVAPQPAFEPAGSGDAGGGVEPPSELRGNRPGAAQRRFVAAAIRDGHAPLSI